MCLQKYIHVPENRKCNFHISRRPGCTVTIYTVHNVNHFSGNFKKNLHENQDRMGSFFESRLQDILCNQCVGENFIVCCLGKEGRRW